MASSAENSWGVLSVDDFEGIPDEQQRQFIADYEGGLLATQGYFKDMPTDQLERLIADYEGGIAFQATEEAAAPLNHIDWLAPELAALEEAAARQRAENDELLEAVATGQGLSPLLVAVEVPAATPAPVQPPHEPPAPAPASTSPPPNPHVAPAADVPPATASWKDRMTAALEASRSRSELQERTRAGLSQRLSSAQRGMQVLHKGVDVCIIMDCTGSMGEHIDAVKRKALAIMGLAPSLHPGSITRLAFVGYRDYGAEAGDAQHIVQDFVDAGSFSLLEQTIDPIRADGGGNAEDVCGALKKATELSWQSSTRLVIHFGDAPCHGSQYHCGRPVNGPDTFPDGDPQGLVPEELLLQLYSLRVDYHFARIGAHTDIMTDVFAEVYREAGMAAEFERHEYGEGAESFLPLVLNSITSSMRRSSVRAAPPGLLAGEEDPLGDLCGRLDA